MTNFDACVVGAGIVGAACAAALAREGMRVCVIDSGGIAGGTTAAGMGHIVVMDDSPAQFALTKYSLDLWNEFAERMPATCEYDHCGTIWVAADEEEMQEVRRKHESYIAQGVETEILDEKALLDAEPNLGYGLAGGLRVPNDTVVYQLTASKWFIDQAIGRGGELRTNSPAVEVSDKGVKLEDGEFIAAGKVVNAAGIGAPALTPGLPIRTRKGHLVITERYPGFVRHQLVELGYLKSAHGSASESVALNVQPRKTGQVLLGSSRQFDVHHDAVDHKILNRMTSRAFEYMPKLRGLTASRIWTGFRPATPDNLPLIGRIPGFENVYAACGHEGLGITSATGTAAVLADLILGRAPAIPAEPYSPARAITQH